MSELSLFPNDTVKLKSKLRTTLGYVQIADINNDNNSDDLTDDGDDHKVRINHIMRRNLHVRTGDIIRYINILLLFYKGFRSLSAIPCDSLCRPVRNSETFTRTFFSS